MADDPRQTLSGADLPPYPYAAIGSAPVPDPLRALLADEDRAIDLIERAMMAGHGTPTTAAGTFSSAESRAVLAALREAAGL